MLDSELIILDSQDGVVLALHGLFGRLDDFVGGEIRKAFDDLTEGGPSERIGAPAIAHDVVDELRCKVGKPQTVSLAEENHNVIVRAES